MALSLSERETIINFNEAESTASAYTHNGRLTHRMEHLERDRPAEVNRDYNGDFLIPKKWIKINPTRIMSDEQKAKCGELLRSLK